MTEPPPTYEAVVNPYVPPHVVKDSVQQQPATNPSYTGEDNTVHYFVPNPYSSGQPPPPNIHQTGPGCPSIPSTTVHTIMVGSIPFHQEPMSMTCPYCQRQIITSVRVRSGLLTWLLCGGMALFGCWLCCLIPFCVHSCQDVEHHCPNCKRFLGTYRRI